MYFEYSKFVQRLVGVLSYLYQEHMSLGAGSFRLMPVSPETGMKNMSANGSVWRVRREGEERGETTAAVNGSRTKVTDHFIAVTFTCFGVESNLLQEGSQLCSTFLVSTDTTHRDHT